MQKPVTIVVTPRDRYSDLAGCISDIYANTDPALFELVILDLAYPRRDLEEAKRVLKGKNNYRIFSYGRIIPIEAFDLVREHLDTKYAFFIDNDSRPTEGWLPPLIETGDKTNAAVINPVTLERAGVDEGADVRNHLFTTELRVVDVDNKPYLIEHKTYRRALPEELPDIVTETQAFELHGVMFNTEVFKALELPRMTVREHLDIGMQLKAKGLSLVVEPRSQIIFDNLGTRANLSDLKYFNLRWNGKITEESSRLFEKRWGYKFYSEESIYNWAIRRKIFLILRWLYLPISVANKIDRIYFGLRRRLFPIWDPLEDPHSNANLLYDQFPDGIPLQLDHSINL
ncbi:MAG: glycosyltransferase [Gammaproteobacteria bacterium]|nr:glycosyltransferase [Gammaproteobacteria bacterium]